MFFRSTENSHVSTNLVHTLYRMQSIGTMPLTSFKKQLDPKSYKRCEEKSVETWYSLTRPIFLDYMYSVSSSIFSTMFFIFIHLHFTLHLYVLINFGFWLILQQELAEASDIALNHYNETHPLERTSEGVSKAMSAAVNKKRAMLSSSFSKQLAIADINLTPAFLEEVKHHWGSFSVPEMLQEKLHRVAVSNVDAEVKVGWLKLWNGNRFDKDALHFPKSPLSDSALDDWVSKSTYWAQLEKKAIEELQSIISSPLQLPADVPTLSEYIQTWKFAAFNSIFYREFKSGKVKKTQHLG